MPSPKELQEKRLSFLHSLYELTGADRNKTIRLEAITQKSGISSAEAVTIGQYLHDERLIAHPLYPAGKARTVAKYVFGPQDLDSYKIRWNPKGQICITHRGIKEIEQALSQPNKATEHFQSVTINNYIQNSGIINNQNLQQATSNSSQTIILDNSRRDGLNEIISQIRDLINEKQIAEEQKEMLELEAKRLELQAKSSKPKLERIRESLSSVKEILDTISTGSPIVAKIIAWLSGLN